MPGCFSVGYNTAKAKLKFLSKKDGNGRMNYNDAAS
jgi:hypothetical protein